jgi:hypothetical protein
VEWVKDTFFLAARALDFLVGSLVAWAAVLMLPWILRDRWSRFAVGAAAVGFGGAFLGTYFFPHYIAPVAFLAVIIAVQGLRRWSLSRIAGWPVGRACVLLVLLLLTVGTVLDWRRDLKGGVRPGYEWAQERASLLRKLEADGGRHLILVRYGDHHDVNASRIANGADIDGSPVVWAHDLDPATNARLLEYFKDRRAWRMTVDLDSDPARLEPYPILGHR